MRSVVPEWMHHDVTLLLVPRAFTSSLRTYPDNNGVNYTSLITLKKLKIILII